MTLRNGPEYSRTSFSQKLSTNKTCIKLYKSQQIGLYNPSQSANNISGGEN